MLLASLSKSKGPRTWCTNDDLKVVHREDHRVILNEICEELREEERGGQGKD